MNWGKGIAFFYACFVVGISAMVYKTFFMKQELIQDNYYEAELVFQSKIDASQQANMLQEKPRLIDEGDSIRVDWGNELFNENIQGQLQILCPNNVRKDVLFNLFHESGKKEPKIHYPQQGYRLVKMDWTFNGKPYYITFHQTF